MKRKIAFVLISPSPYALQRFKELSKYSDIELFLFFEFPRSFARDDWNITEINNCKIEILNSYIFNKKSFKTLPYKLPYFLYKHKPDIVITSNAKQSLFIIPLKSILKFKIGIVVEDTLFAVKKTNQLDQKIKSLIYKKADFYLPFSNDAIEYLNSLKINKPFLRTSWSVDLDYFRNFDQQKVIEIKKGLGINNKLIFLTVSRLEPGKGIMNFLSAWKDLPEEIHEKIAYMIVGGGPQESEIKNFANVNNLNNVYVLGSKKYIEVVNYYHAADVFVLPTLKDLFSLVVMEAMACSLPVLTTIYNGARELIVEGQNGYIFDSANIEDISKVIIKIYHDKERLKEMGKSSINIIKKYSHEQVIETLYNILLTT